MHKDTGFIDLHGKDWKQDNVDEMSKRAKNQHNTVGGCYNQKGGTEDVTKVTN